MEKKICPTCGREFDGLSKYCTECGIELETKRDKGEKQMEKVVNMKIDTSQVEAAIEKIRGDVGELSALLEKASSLWCELASSMNDFEAELKLKIDF